MRLACEVCACGERTRLETRRPDRTSMPRCASGDLASPKCKPSYMDWSRTACTAPARSWYATGGSRGIEWAFYGAVGPPSRTSSIFGKSEMWGRHISLCPPKGPKMRSRLPYRSVYATETCFRLRIPSRFACTHSDESTRPQAVPTHRRAEGVFIHTQRGAVNRPLAVTWYATGTCSVCRIAGRSRWANSERALRVFSIPSRDLYLRTAYCSPLWTPCAAQM